MGAFEHEYARTLPAKGSERCMRAYDMGVDERSRPVLAVSEWLM